MKAIAVLLAIGATALLIVGLSALSALPVMWLWNWLIPALFHGPSVTFIQAWGGAILSALLFKGTYRGVS